MKPIKFIYLLVAFFTVAPLVYSQEYLMPGMLVKNQRVEKNQGEFFVSFDIAADGLPVNRNDMVVLTPVLRSNANPSDSVTLPPVVIAGKKRHQILRRKSVLGEPMLFTEEPQVILKHEKNTPQEIPYKVAVAFRSWMDNASLSVVHNVSGCADCISLVGDKLLNADILPKPYEPVYRLTYIMPEAEEKERSERYDASLNYPVNQWNLLRDYRDNAQEFAEVDRVVNEIKNNPDFKITQVEIHGYASPEASVSHNRMLSRNRATAFADYLVTRFRIDRKQFVVTGHGEDWDGLREAVEASSLSDKQAVLGIIDREPDPDARDAELKKLSRGETYRTLLNRFYPPLRRIEYVVAYNVRAFDVEEARDIIRRDPKLLNLNEMYLVAQSYPSGSEEFKEVFDIAVRLYPESDLAILNSASADIESGNLDGAIARMTRIAANPKVWNNLGVAFARKGEFEKAMEFFSKAAGGKDEEALHNLNELKKVLGQ